MTKIIRGLVLELKPDNAQKLLLDKHLNDTKFIYNKYVEEYLNCIKENRLLEYKDYKELRAEHEFLKGSYAWTLQRVLYVFKQTNKINRSTRSYINITTDFGQQFIQTYDNVGVNVVKFSTSNFWGRILNY